LRKAVASNVPALLPRGVDRLHGVHAGIEQYLQRCLTCENRALGYVFHNGTPRLMHRGPACRGVVLIDRCEEAQKRLFKAAMGNQPQRAVFFVEQLHVAFGCPGEGDGAIDDMQETLLEIAVLGRTNVADLLEARHGASRRMDCAR